MKKIINLLILLMLICFPKYGFSLDQKYHEVVQHFIDSVKNNNRSEVVRLTALPYQPIKRKYPLPSIKTGDEFLQRYDEVFDKNLIEIICNSDINNDWNTASAGAWGGIMLKNGILWLDLRGKLKVINYESEIEKRKRNELINEEKKKLHISLHTFLEPVLEWKTKHYHIRVDKLGEWKYRYAVWPVDKSTSEKPDLVLNNGEYIPEGSAGINYDFKNGDYKYRCSVIYIGRDEDPPGKLEVYKNEKLILREPVIEVMNQ